MGAIEPGPRDHLVTRWLEEVLRDLDPELLDEIRLDPAEAPERLSRHAMEVLRARIDPEGSADEQSALVNRLVEGLTPDPDPEEEIAIPARVLRGIRARSPLNEVLPLPPLPATPFSQSDLLVNGEGQPSVGSELKAELASAQSVDLICAFVIWSGVRHLRDALKGVIARGGRVRVITTTYMGATEKRAVDELFDLGAEVRIALDARTTKLHAKAWLMKRPTGLTTAFVGSSNLSHTALFDGLEWNVRLSSMDAAHVIRRVETTFESHWSSEHFEPYDPAVNGDDLAKALQEHDRRSLGEATTISFANLDVRPYPHQRRMLDALMVERERQDRHANLVVAATGTGKTVVAALDYAQLRSQMGGDPSLLFVAHRQEILEQSLNTYRAVLKDGSFGEIHGGGRAATAGKHVFAMVQSLGEERIAAIDPEAYDVVVIDEFHHAKARTYDRLLKHLRPKELLGLTATPERMDGQDVTEWFGGRIAVELRLWEAIDQGFLVPFQYFGVADGTDLSAIRWSRSGYAIDELSNVLTGNDMRVSKLLSSLQRIVYDPGAMRALGFCVSVEHARYMARKFTEAGLESVALSGEDSPDERREQLVRLRNGDLRCVFSVEVLGEGVDLPDVDCLLLLRPTQSATVFTQQLGRGLRRAEGKSHVTVIDMIGQQRREFRFEDRLRAIVDTRRGTVVEQVEGDFPFLPAGCSVDLDRQSREIVLDNLRQAARRTQWPSLVADLRRETAALTFGEYLERSDRRLEDIYRRGSWTELQREAGKDTAEAVDADLEETSLRGLRRITHVDDPERLAFYRRILGGEAPAPDAMPLRERRMLTMLAWGLGSRDSGAADLRDYYHSLWAERAVRDELGELLDVVDARSETRAAPSSLPPEIPLSVHARYSRAEIVAALGSGEGVKPKVTQGGILWVEQARSDVFFIDLHKAERDYSPTTMYRDYAINRELFHWESQSRQTPEQPSVQRYINHRERGTNVLLFVRERKRDELGTSPFTFLGPVEYVDHEGQRPVAFTWKLATPMPEELFESARSVAAA